MEADRSPRYCLPAIGRVELSGFDLYRRKPDVRINIDRSVFCLIGANGLGKSTFLTTLLYGLTGAIPNREAGFPSPGEYAENATRQPERRDYFGGRVSEAATEHASVRLGLRWPDARATVTRQLFGTGAASEVEIEREGNGGADVFTGDSAEAAYQEFVVEKSQLPGFDQFVFLVHYVCVFDEERHLLLWDGTALTNALYLAFGSDAEQAATANELKRKVERLGSRARNSRYAARQALDAAAKLRRAMSDDDDTEPDAATRRRFERLNGQLEEAGGRVRRKDAELRKSEAVVVDRSAALTGLQLEYDEAFAARTDASSIVLHHPLVRSTLQGDRCAVCAAAGAAERVRSALDKAACPLCGSGITAGADDAANMETLRDLDGRIEAVRADLQEAHERRKRLQDDYDASLQAEAAARETRDEFLAENPEAEREPRTEAEAGAVNAAIERARAEAKRFDLKSKQEYRERDAVRRELHAIERQLQSNFDRHSDELTGLFRSYATAFVGLAVDIELEHRKGKVETGFDLLLSLEDQARARAEDVSESQRFFLDIALRMALAESMSANGATLVVDTPEGSLDITYEARAGQMFSDFATGGNAILMTANLRSSELVLRLAELQKRAGMQVERMTDWAELSEVQQAEEGLFDQAYAEINRALK
ncbi:MAG: ATP-binding protein [Gammaproteobacteria bacterium]|nr:ATP-binding protein [Gammaproteobacteria bacterium]